jgi:signal transduction histidine kinase/DNA-binding response OmpR family regulator
MDFVHPEDREATMAESRKLSLGNSTSISFQNRYLHKNGGYRWMRWIAASDVATRTILASAQDITEERERNRLLTAAREEAEEASIAKSRFLANMSHELRTPLNSVIGFSELLHDETFGPLNPKQCRYVENIMSNGRHLLDLINDILDLSKVEAGQMDFEISKVDMVNLAREVLDKVRPLAEKKELMVHLEVQSDSCRAIGDEGRTRQILLNLLSNAIKFTPDQGEIGLRLRADSKECLVTIWDTGRGLVEEDLTRVFERFKQVDSGLTRKESGTGLGLALCRHFVEQQQGRLWATSEGLDNGAQFHFSLPAPEPEIEMESTVPEDGDEPLVLVVEDDPCSSELLTTHLASAGYRTVRAFTGEKALKLAEELRPGAITLDLELPDMSGWEVLGCLKSSAATSRIPVIVSSIVDDRAQGISMQVSDFVPKPLNRDLLLETMMRHLPGGNRRKVLLIDDDPDVLELISQLLASKGIEVYEARGGEQGLELLRECRPDAIIVDLNMPGLDGYDTIEKIRELHSAEIPIVVFTSADLSTSEQARLQSTTEKIVSKSKRQDLLTVLRQVFNKEARS